VDDAAPHHAGQTGEAGDIYTCTGKPRLWWGVFESSYVKRFRLTVTLHKTPFGAKVNVRTQI
jgi:hypothetical protein